MAEDDKKNSYYSISQINLLHPVGSILFLKNNTDPNTIYPGTTWTKISPGRVLVSSGSYSDSSGSYTYDLGATGGEAKHKITTAELAAHNHSGSGSATSAVTNHYHYLMNTDRINAKQSTNMPTATTYFAHCRDASGSSETYIAGGSGTYPTIAKSSNAVASGSTTVSLTINNTGSGSYHENRQPYLVVNVWERTA